MGSKSKIEWTDATWNPMRGCTRVSEGCRNCYAERMAARFSSGGETDQSGEVVLSAGPFFGFAKSTPSGPRWTGKVALSEDQLMVPLQWRKPRRVFVNSMSDTSHESLPDEAIDRVFRVMRRCQHHTFIVLTKRAERMQSYLSAIRATPDGLVTRNGVYYADPNAGFVCPSSRWPLPNVWLGVSVEDQEAADERIPHLLATPAAVRFVSCEPLLGPLDLYHYLPSLPGSEQSCCHPAALDWVIAGGESGPSARPMQAEWAQSLRDQCAQAGVPFFWKQWGEYLPPGQDGAPGDHQILNAFYGPIRVGKRAAGNLLDGMAWQQFPEVSR